MTDTTPAPGLNTALAAFQDAFQVVPLDGENPHFGSRYATLPTIVQKMTPVLRTHGLMFKSRIDTDGGASSLVVELLHIVSGENMTSRMALPAGNPQAIGSAITYYRRYAMLTMTGAVADGDDDGNQAIAPATAHPRSGRVQMMSQEQFDALVRWQESGVVLAEAFFHVLERAAQSGDMTYDEAARVLTYLQSRENAKG